MKFKKGDIIALNEEGRSEISPDNCLNIKKTTLFRVTYLINNREVNIEKLDGTNINGGVSVNIFRLATSLEIKLYEVEKIFS